MFKLNFLSLSSTTTSCFDFLAIVVSDSWTNQNSSTFKVKEVNVVSAFPLTRHEKEILGEKLKKKLGANIGLKEALDPKLVAGFMISVGSIVVDASLKYKIQSNIKHS